MAFGTLRSQAGNGTSPVSPGTCSLGDLIVLWFRNGPGSGASTISDNLGNTYNLVTTIDDGSILKAWMYYAYVTAAGSCTISISGGGGANNTHALIFEGPFATGPLQDSGAASGTDTTGHCGALDGPRTASALLVAAFYSGGQPYTGGDGGWTVDWNALDTGAYALVEHVVASSFSNAQPLPPMSAASTYWGIGAVFNTQAIIRPDAGSYTLSGTATPLIYDRVFPMDAGAYVVTGDSVALQLGARRNPSMYVTGIAPAYAIDLEVTSQQ